MKYYVVFEGLKPGIYQSWEECSMQVNGVKGAKYRSFRALKEALKAYDDYLETGSSKQKKYINRFAGGYSLSLPFRLNEQQIEVINQIDEFVNSPGERTMTVSGWAGTGKTTLMEIVAKRYWLTHKVFFSATTHKAAGVLRSKVGKSVSTVNSLFGINVEVDMDGEHFDAASKKNTKGDEKIDRNSLVIIDEASMLSEENYREVIRICDFYNSKVIFVGDSAQLSPVNEEDISIVFRDSQARIVELTKVERTDDDSILNEATDIRTGGSFSYKSGSSVSYLNGNSSTEINEVFDRFIPGLMDDPNYFRVLTYTNRNVEKLNMAVRKKLGYTDALPRKGEPLMSYSNWGYMGSYPTTKYAFINSEAYTCGEVKGNRKIDIREMLTGYVPQEYVTDGKILIDVTDIELIDALGNTVDVPFIDVRDSGENRKAVMLLAHEKINQWNRYRRAEGKPEKIDCIRKINSIDGLLFVNDSVRDDDGHLLQQKVIDFGYAHTIHKSQGSTFEHVLINDMDIENCPDEKVRRQLRYVAITRARQSATVISRNQ